MANRKQPSDYFIFERPLGDNRSRTETIVYVGGGHLEVGPLIEHLRRHHLTHGPPERVVLIGSEPREDALNGLAHDSRLIDTLPSITRYVQPPLVEVWTFN